MIFLLLNLKKALIYHTYAHMRHMSKYTYYKIFREKIKKTQDIVVFSVDNHKYVCYTMRTNKMRNMRRVMNIQGFQRLTLLDFPEKTACTIFTGGCNLRCPFCHNGSLVRKPVENPNAADDVLSYLEKRKGILDGVCVTGGEPLLQPDIVDFIKKVRAMGFFVKLDTNGALPEKLKAVIPYINYIAMDVKSSFENYSLATGSEIDVEIFKESINIIRNSGIDHEFRTTAVKGIHKKEDFIAIAKYLKGENKYFIQKFVDSGNLLVGGEAFTKEEMLDILQEIKKYVSEAEIRGEK